MISGEDFYNVMSAVVPLYVAMILAYGSVRWWGLLTPDQCSGINRFVALFAVPLLSFQIISKNNPYEMDPHFIAADAMQKGLVLAVLTAWCRWDTRRASLEWLITHFMVATLPNTLVMGIPLLGAMYGKHGGLVVQAVVLQCIVWYTLLLILYEYRAAKLLIVQQFPAGTAASIVSFKVDSDVISLDGREGPVMTEAEVGGDGRIHVKVRRSTSSAPRFSSASSMQMQLINQNQNPQQYGGPILRSPMASMFSSKAGTPRPSNLTGAEIYSLQSSRNMTPRESNFGRGDLYLMGGGGAAAGGGATMFAPRLSNVNTSLENGGADHVLGAYSPSPALQLPKKVSGAATTVNPASTTVNHGTGRASDYDARELHMFVWSSSASPTSERGGVHVFGGTDDGLAKETKVVVVDDARGDSSRDHRIELMQQEHQEFSFVGSERADDKLVEPKLESNISSTVELTTPKIHQANGLDGINLNNGNDNPTLPPASVMTRLILNMVWRKLIRNPNTYSSVIGIVWALVSFRWDVKAPKIIEKSITILSDAGLGMAMFSLGLFMALQTRLLACGTSMALFGMLLRFFCGPAIMSVTSIATGLRSLDLRASIVQAALPSGIVPFVFAKEYNVHPDVLSTAVIFGMLVALPITLIYYVLLGI